MTSASVTNASASPAPRGVRSRRVRAAAAALGVAGALALTACGGDGSGDSDESTAAPAPSATDSGGTDGGSGPSGAPAGELEGSWLTTAGGRAVALMFNGEKAALFATGGTVCSGTARQSAGTHSIRLKCSDGNEDRTNGTVDSVGGSSLKVTWDGPLGTETYTKADGAELPTGLPTAGLGS